MTVQHVIVNHRWNNKHPLRIDLDIRGETAANWKWSLERPVEIQA